MASTTQTQPAITPQEARAIAKDAYLYGFPLVDSYRIQYSYFVDKNGKEYKAPWNTIFNNARLYTAADKAIQTPNADTPYSYIGADLRAEPLVISVPEMGKDRFYHAQFIDMYTFNFAYVGSRTTGNGAGNYLLAGPDWKGDTPAGVKSVIRCETQFAFILIRTQLFNPADIDSIKKIQAGYTVQLLSQFLKQPASSAAPATEFMKPIGPEDERRSLDFFKLLNFVLQFCPTHPSEVELMARFAKLGIGAGREFNPDSLSFDVRNAIEDGRADAWQAYEGVKQDISAGKVRTGDLAGTRDYVKNNYLYRFVAAADGIYANSKEEAVYPVYFVDSSGQKMDGSHRYQLRLAPGQFPPVNAFWSLTLYELPASLFYDNPLNRYLINSPMLPGLTKDPDGGLTVYLQHKSPGSEKESNWLPAPAGPFWVGLRLYAPKEEALNGTWKQPPLERQD